MVNISELKKDMRSYMTIEEVLQKHSVSFADAVRLCSKTQSRKPNGKGKPQRVYERTDAEKIYKYGRKFVIKKKVDGKQRWFGSYKTIEDAVKVRDYMNENGWEHTKVKAIREMFGV